MGHRFLWKLDRKICASEILGVLFCGAARKLAVGCAKLLMVAVASS